MIQICVETVRDMPIGFLGVMVPGGANTGRQVTRASAASKSSPGNRVAYTWYTCIYIMYTI